MRDAMMGMAAGIVGLPLLLGVPTRSAAPTDGIDAGSTGGEHACTRRIEAMKKRLGYGSDADSTDDGVAIEFRDGTSHKYSESGPSEPVESWFDDSPRPPAVAVNALESAIGARSDGDMARCHEKIAEAEQALDAAPKRLKDRR